MQKNYKVVDFVNVSEGLNVHYNNSLFDDREGDRIFKILESTVEYNTDDESKIRIHGKEVYIPRKQAGYGDAGTSYTFSGVTVQSKSWNGDDILSITLQAIRKKVENYTGAGFNFVLINRYKNGTEYIGPHADDEKDLHIDSPIVGVSFGAARDMVFHHKGTTKKIEFTLHHGSIVCMNPPTNQFWKHSVPKRLKVRGPRISLTFRNIINP